MISDVREVLGGVGRLLNAVKCADNVKEKIRRQMDDYESVLQVMRDECSDSMFTHELKRLVELVGKIEQLHKEHTAGPQDGKAARIAKIINRGSQHVSIEDALKEIDREIFRQFTAISAKSAAVKRKVADLRPRFHLSTEAQLAVAALFGWVFIVFAAVMSTHRGEMFRAFRRIEDRMSLRPPPLPDMAAVPSGALAMPRSYVERQGVHEAIGDLIKPGQPRTPYTVVGMGGGGKTVLASAIVREESVRNHFRGGIFWVKVGRGAKDSLLPLLQGLAREIDAAAPTDAPHAVPPVVHSLEEAKKHLTAVASAGASPRLVVLDDVWEREVVDALLPLGLKLLVTTRDRSVVGVPGGWLELGTMSEDESLELLRKTSMTVDQPGDHVRAQMTKVAALCGHLPLALAIAGSMSVVRGKGLTAGAWEKLLEEFRDVSEKMRARGEQTMSIKLVLETSLDALSRRRQRGFLKMAVLAAGAVAPVEMLLNLWEMEDVEGAREEADGLASKCLLQDVGGGQYRVHDIVLEFLKDSIKGNDVKKATVLQAQYLSRLDVVKEYVEPRSILDADTTKSFAKPEHGPGRRDTSVLKALWLSVEKLAGDPGLEDSAYRTSLRELDSLDAAEDVATSYFAVGVLFKYQGKYTEAAPLYERSQAMFEKLLGPDHLRVAAILYYRALLFSTLGKHAEAESLFKRCRIIREKILGRGHPDVNLTVFQQAKSLKSQGKDAEAKPLFRRHQAQIRNVMGDYEPHPDLMCHNRANMLKNQGKYAEAAALFEECEATLEKSPLGHPVLLANAFESHAEVFQSQGKYAEAEPLYERCQATREKFFGPEHPLVAETLISRAILFEEQGKYAQADALYLRAIEIGEEKLGLYHPDLAKWLQDRATMLNNQGKHDEAVQLFERALSINTKALGDDHPDTVDTKNMLEGVRGKNVRIGREARCGDQGCNKHPSYGAVLGATKMTKKEWENSQVRRGGGTF